MISDIRRYLDLKTRADLVTFIQRTFQTVAGGQTYDHNWHIDAIAWNLRLCTSGEVKRLAIMLPPRNLKSICASVAFPAWLLGHDPTRRIVCASYSDNLAEKLALDCRAVMESEWYRRIFPRTRISREKNSRADFMTTARGGRFSTSVGGTLTGRGGNIIIIDDPLKPDDAFSEAKRTAVNEWYDRTVVSRLDDKRTGVIIIIMQRLHLEDLVGHVISKNTTFEWSFLELPAIAQENEYILIGDKYQIHYRAPGELLHEARESREVLEQLRRQQGVSISPPSTCSARCRSRVRSSSGGGSAFAQSHPNARPTTSFCKAGTPRPRRANSTTIRSAPPGWSRATSTICSTSCARSSTTRICTQRLSIMPCVGFPRR